VTAALVVGVVVVWLGASIAAAVVFHLVARDRREAERKARGDTYPTPLAWPRYSALDRTEHGPWWGHRDR
jgi:hypothetical protein